MLTKGGCPRTMLSIKDALEAIAGKWKLLVLFTLADGPKRFTQIANEVTGITDKTLSKELKSLEANRLIIREVRDMFPPRVEYSITDHGKSLERVMDELHFWGLAHRGTIIGKSVNNCLLTEGVEIAFTATGSDTAAEVPHAFCAAT